jgi:hypothetical protein
VTTPKLIGLFVTDAAAKARVFSSGKPFQPDLKKVGPNNFFFVSSKPSDNMEIIFQVSGRSWFYNSLLSGRYLGIQSTL